MRLVPSRFSSKVRALNPIIFWMLMNNARRRNRGSHAPPGPSGAGGREPSIVVLCLLGLGIVACLLVPGVLLVVLSVPIEVVETKTVTVEIVSVNPPKHAGAEVRDVETGTVT